MSEDDQAGFWLAPPAPRTRPHDELDTISYAISFLSGARRICRDRMEDNDVMALPFYTLTGFAVENGLKAYLEAKCAPKPKEWSHSHDLTDLRYRATEEFLLLDIEQVRFVDHLSAMHSGYHFRYPKKAGRIELLQPKRSLALTDTMLAFIFLQIGAKAACDRLVWHRGKSRPGRETG